MQHDRWLLQNETGWMTGIGRGVTGGIPEHHRKRKVVFNLWQAIAAKKNASCDYLSQGGEVPRKNDLRRTNWKNSRNCMEFW